MKRNNITVEERPLPRSIADMPRTRAAQEKLGELQTELATIERQISTGRGAGHPLERAQAAVVEPALLERLARLKVAVETASLEHQRAREADSEDARARYLEATRAIFRALVPKLEAAAVEMRRLQLLEEAEHAAFGAALDRFAVGFLCTNDEGLSPLDEWIDRARRDGLID